MNDKTPLQGHSEPNNNDCVENEVNDSKDRHQTIFDERFAALTDGFGKACEQHGVHTAIAIAMHPDESYPIVFIRGHKFDAAKLLANVLKVIKNNIQAELQTDAD